MLECFVNPDRMSSKRNSKTAEHAIEDLTKRRSDLIIVLHDCQIDGVRSLHNLRYEISRRLQNSSIYNIPEDQLRAYLIHTYHYPVAEKE